MKNITIQEQFFEVPSWVAWIYYHPEIVVGITITFIILLFYYLHFKPHSYP